MCDLVWPTDRAFRHHDRTPISLSPYGLTMKIRFKPSVYVDTRDRDRNRCGKLQPYLTHHVVRATSKVSPPRSYMYLPIRSFRLHRQGPCRSFTCMYTSASRCHLYLAPAIGFPTLSGTKVAARDNKTSVPRHVEDQYQPRPCPCGGGWPLRTVAAALHPQPRHSSSITVTPTGYQGLTQIRSGWQWQPQ